MHWPQHCLSTVEEWKSALAAAHRGLTGSTAAAGRNRAWEGRRKSCIKLGFEGPPSKSHVFFFFETDRTSLLLPSCTSLTLGQGFPAFCPADQAVTVCLAGIPDCRLILEPTNPETDIQASKTFDSEYLHLVQVLQDCCRQWRGGVAGARSSYLAVTGAFVADQRICICVCVCVYILDLDLHLFLLVQIELPGGN